jgi:hypothetical protein
MIGTCPSKCIKSLLPIPLGVVKAFRLTLQARSREACTTLLDVVLPEILGVVGLSGDTTNFRDRLWVTMAELNLYLLYKSLTLHVDAKSAMEIEAN